MYLELIDANGDRVDVDDVEGCGNRVPTSISERKGDMLRFAPGFIHTQIRVYIECQKLSV